MFLDEIMFIDRYNNTYLADTSYELITNFSECYTHIYEQAIKASQLDGILEIKDRTFDIYGKEYFDGSKALVIKKEHRFDLSHFWEVFKEFEIESINSKDLGW